MRGQILICILSMLTLTKSQFVGSKESQMITQLVGEVSRFGRPVVNVSDAVEVTIGITLQQILEVDVVKGNIKTLCWFNMEWNSPFLQWDLQKDSWGDSKPNEVKDMSVEIEKIWLPDIEVYNQIERKDLRFRDSAVLTNTGSLTWIPSYQLTTTCKMDTTWFPFDDQDCEIKLGSWTHNGFKINLVMNSDEGMDTSSYVVNSEWALVGTPGSRNEVIYECCPEPYLDVTYTIKLRRRTLPYLQKYVLPAFMLTLVSILSLLIPSSSSTSRLLIIFISTILLLLCTPPNLPQPSILASLLTTCHMINFLLLIETILSTSITNGQPTYDKYQQGIVSLINCFKTSKNSNEQILYQMSRYLDLITLILFLVGFLLAFLILLFSAW